MVLEICGEKNGEAHFVKWAQQAQEECTEVVKTVSKGDGRSERQRLQWKPCLPPTSVWPCEQATEDLYEAEGREGGGISS